MRDQRWDREERGRERDREMRDRERETPRESE